jgi:hypothetical protein
MAEVRWQDDPEEHDYPAAAAYLSMLAAGAVVDELVERLRAAVPAQFAAKDVLRAAGLPLLPPANPHVAADLKKIHSGRALSPVLLVRGDLATGVPLQIADGYHRVCASYHTDENTVVRCRLADPPHVG